MTENKCTVITFEGRYPYIVNFESTADIIDSCLRRKDKIISILEKTSMLVLFEKIVLRTIAFKLNLQYSYNLTLYQ
jgi:hypothetical protein